AAHRRDDEQPGRVRGQSFAAEMTQRAERLLEHDGFLDRVLPAIDRHLANPELGLAALLVEMGEDLQRAGDDRAGAEVAHRQRRVAEQLRPDRSPVARAVEQRPVQLVGVVEQVGRILSPPIWRLRGDVAMRQDSGTGFPPPAAIAGTPRFNPRPISANARAQWPAPPQSPTSSPLQRWARYG